MAAIARRTTVESAKAIEPRPAPELHRLRTPAESALRVQVHALVNDVLALHLHLEMLANGAALFPEQRETIRILQRLGASIVARSHDMAGGRATKTPPRRAARMTGKAELASGGLTKG
jgi:hypothetical protein